MSSYFITSYMQHLECREVLVSVCVCINYVLINDTHLTLLYRSKNWGCAGSCAQANCGNTEHRLYLVGK